MSGYPVVDSVLIPAPDSLLEPIPVGHGLGGPLSLIALHRGWTVFVLMVLALLAVYALGQAFKYGDRDER